MEHRAITYTESRAGGRIVEDNLALFGSQVVNQGDHAILASHPVYQYFSRRYRFNMQNVHWEPEEIQPASEWQQLEILLEKFPAKWMIWEMPPRLETVDALARLGVTPLVFYTIANRPEQTDFMSVMHQNIETLKRINQSR